MRELKFRVWSKRLNKYVGGMLIGQSGGLYSMLLGFEIIEEENDNYEVEQYTGLKDKNGKEIYEGDIVQESNGKTVVEFSTEGIGSCGCCVDKFWGSGFIVTINDSPEDCEVIGNIHENKELLEEK